MNTNTWHIDRIVKSIKRGEAIRLLGWTFLSRDGKWFVHQNGKAWQHFPYGLWLDLLGTRLGKCMKEGRVA